MCFSPYSTHLFRKNATTLLTYAISIFIGFWAYGYMTTIRAIVLIFVVLRCPGAEVLDRAGHEISN
jgi:hypothetical protein